MAEYIDRDTLKDRIAGFVPPFIDESNRAYVDGLTDAYTLICQAPVADVRPVVRGHWIGKKEAEDMGDIMKEFNCSACGCCEWDCTESESFNFCPNCGAKMGEPADV